MYKTVSTAYLSKAIFLACKVIAIPLFLLHFSTEEYAAFAIFSGLEGWFLLLDFGMGASLQNKLASAKEDETTLYTTALLYLLIFFILSFIGLYLLQDTLIYFLGNKLGLIDTLQKSFWIASISLFLSSFGSVVSKAFLAKQKGTLFFTVQAISYTLSLILLICAIYAKMLSLPLATFIFFGIPNLASALLGVSLFKKICLKSAIHWDLILKAKQFFLFGLMGAFVCLSDTWILSHTLTLSQVVEYNVLCKLFGLAAFAYAPILHSLIPTFSLLFSENKGHMVNHIVKKQCFYWICIVFAFAISIILSSSLLEKVFAVALSSISILAFGMYLSLRLIADFYTGALQAKAILSHFFYLIPIQALISISLQYTLSLHAGVTGLLIGMALSYLLTVCFILPKKLKKTISA